MKSEFTSQALDDLKKLNTAQLEAVKAKVDEIEDNPTSHEDIKLIRVKGRELYRVRVRTERGAEIDHRIVYDIVEGKIIIYSVIDRDSGYDKNKLADRI